MSERKTTRVEVETIFAGDYPNTLSEFIAILCAHRESVPEKWRESAGVEFGGGDDFAWIEIYYDRPETDEQMAKRMAGYVDRTREARERDLRQLAALKAKYEAAKLAQ